MWDPAVRGGWPTERLPDVGALIAVNRKPYRFLSASPRNPADWTPRERDAWLSDGSPDPWDRGPMMVVLAPVPSGRRRHCVVDPWHGTWWYDLLPEHYAVCAVCGELAPCTEITAERQARREMKRVEHLIGILPGCCWACGEIVTHRQGSRRFPGENLLLPGGHPVIFHTRRACRGALMSYAARWDATNDDQLPLSPPVLGEPQ